ncbi:hypothetical protein L6R53_09580 [Myxococcota bacterium]|nr:hypothetical protein [Myxococcota bacterium]
MHPLAQRVSAAAPGSVLLVGPDEPPLAAPLRIDRPLTLQGGDGVTLRGHARDALVVVTSPGVILSDLRLERRPHPDGRPSWGSVVVVEGPGDLLLRRCELVGAADAFAVEPQATLAPGEAWRHAGLDLRGTGHATVEDCGLQDHSQAVSVSIFPADARPNLRGRGLRICGAQTAVAVMADARVQLDDLRVEAGVDVALRLDNGSRLRGAGLVVAGARVACWVDGQARAELSRVDLSAWAAALVVRDRAQAQVRGGRLACLPPPAGAERGSGVEAHGAADVRLEAVTLQGAAVALWARDGAGIQAAAVQLAGAPPDWLAWADVAAVIEVDPDLPGARGCAGLARVTGAQATAWDLATWADTLAPRAAHTRPELRRAMVEACQAAWEASPAALPAELRAPLRALLFQWQERGAEGLRGPPLLVPRTDTPLPAKVVALAADQDLVFASLADQTLRAWDPQGQERWRVRCPASPHLLARDGRLLAMDARGRALRAFDARDGAALGTVSTRAAVVAIALGPTVELCTQDTDGHPTDRSTWRERWSPPAAQTQADCAQQGPTLLPGAWHWVAPDQGGAGPTRRGRVFAPGIGELDGGVVMMVDGRAVVADDHALRVYGPGAAILAALPIPGVTALAAGTCLWLATREGRLRSYTLAG